jgi:hypothetical protein
MQRSGDAFTPPPSPRAALSPRPGRLPPRCRACTAPDIFEANGHLSGESTEDYDDDFWLHDIYDGESSPNEALGILFGETGKGLHAGRESWDGYQKNHLLMNRRGTGFVNVAFFLDWPVNSTADPR